MSFVLLSKTAEMTKTYSPLSFWNLNDNLNTQYVPNVSGDQFVQTYNSLVNCDQVGAIRAIANADEFLDGTDLAAPRAVYFDLENQGGPTTVLIELNNFFCNACRKAKSFLLH